MAHAFAQDAPPAPVTRTGDVWVDRQLDDISLYGARYRDAFIDELVRYHGAPRELVLELLERKWPPGDIYYACALGSVSGRPCRHVVDQYRHGEGPDWHAVAQRMGVTMDSPQYRRLKRGLVATYARWGRPIEAEVAPAIRKPEAPRTGDASPKPPVAAELAPVPPAGADPVDFEPTGARRRPDDRRRGDR